MGRDGDRREHPILDLCAGEDIVHVGLLPGSDSYLAARAVELVIDRRCQYRRRRVSTGAGEEVDPGDTHRRVVPAASAVRRPCPSCVRRRARSCGPGPPRWRAPPVRPSSSPGPQRRRPTPPPGPSAVGGPRGSSVAHQAGAARRPRQPCCRRCPAEPGARRHRRASPPSVTCAGETLVGAWGFPPPRDASSALLPTHALARASSAPGLLLANGHCDGHRRPVWAATPTCMMAASSSWIMLQRATGQLVAEGSSVPVGRHIRLPLRARLAWLLVHPAHRSPGL